MPVPALRVRLPSLATRRHPSFSTNGCPKTGLTLVGDLPAAHRSVVELVIVSMRHDGSPYLIRRFVRPGQGAYP
jgi:hypothetical protein